MRILISGSVGTGKSTIGKKLGDKLNIACFETKKLSDKHPSIIDTVRNDVDVIDVEKLSNVLKNFNDFIFPSHLSHLLDIDYDFLFVLKTDLSILKKRLEKRNYSNEKIESNLMVERFNTIYYECLEQEKNPIVINTDKSISGVVNKILKIIKK